MNDVAIFYAIAFVGGNLILGGLTWLVPGLVVGVATAVLVKGAQKTIDSETAVEIAVAWAGAALVGGSLSFGLNLLLREIVHASALATWIGTLGPPGLLPCLLGGYVTFSRLEQTRHA